MSCKLRLATQFIFKPVQIGLVWHKSSHIYELLKSILKNPDKASERNKILNVGSTNGKCNTKQSVVVCVEAIWRASPCFIYLKA